MNERNPYDISTYPKPRQSKATPYQLHKPPEKACTFCGGSLRECRKGHIHCNVCGASWGVLSGEPPK